VEFVAQSAKIYSATITQVTGITNDMARDAPLFAEMADGFMRFVIAFATMPA
jgi:DNA polymerase III epsilon subunit-like protein